MQDYQAFLEYMCPGYSAKGFLAPLAMDKSVCPRPFAATWDDHDFG